MRLLGSGRLGLGTSVSDLQEMVASLEAQLVSLYEERAQGGLHDEVDQDAIYIAKIAQGTDTIADLQLTVTNLNAQLVALYDEKLSWSEALAAAQESVASLDAQLCDLYGAQGKADLDQRALQETVESLEAQLCALYDEKVAAGEDDLRLAVDSLEAQVICLTDEKMALEAALAKAEANLQRFRSRMTRVLESIVDQAIFED